MAKKDMRSQLAKARDDFFSSEQGIVLRQGTTSGDFLWNRLEKAFIEGWDACEVAQDKRRRNRGEK